MLSTPFAAPFFEKYISPYYRDFSNPLHKADVFLGRAGALSERLKSGQDPVVVALIIQEDAFRIGSKRQ